MMLPPAVDFPPPRPAQMTASPDSSVCSVAVHGSQGDDREDVPDVSPRWMPTRSPTLAVAVGTAAARVVTGIRRLYAVVPSRSPGMNSRATAYLLAGADRDLWREELPHGGGPLEGFVLGGPGDGDPVPAGRPRAETGQAEESSSSTSRAFDA